MKILKKTIIIVLIMITVIFSLIPPKIVRASNNTVAEVGNAIASVAKDFFKRFSTSTVYDYGIKYYYNGDVVPDSWGRQQAYKNIMTSGMAYRNLGNGYKELEVYDHKYAIDCVGFVSMIIHRATGLGGSTFTCFGVPFGTGNGTGVSVNYVGVFNSYSYWNTNIQAGDILCWEGHVAIAIGDGMMIDSGNEGTNGQITRRPITNYHNGETPEYIVRISESTADTLVNSGSLNRLWYEEAEYQASPSTSVTNDNNYTVTDNSNKYEIKENPFGNADEFYYNGMPLEGNYLGNDESNWLIDALSNVADWLIGVITLGYKIQIVGWTSIIQNLATNIVNTIVNSNSGQAITAENILFNKIQILDIDFFDFNTAGGENISSNDLVYALRQNVATIYYAIRNIAIIVLLIILLYIGIRMVLSTISGNKAKYKKMFFAWCIGFIIIMFIHYFMIVIINVNEQIIGSLSPAEDATVIYDDVRSYAYEIPASKGWTGTIMYVFLVYYMIKLLIFYFKRLMIVYLLAIMGPILGLAYAIEMVKGKSKSFTTWMKEFSFNVLIQSIHVIIYSVFMDIIYQFMNKVSIMNLIPYAIIMILILNLMMRSEKIIKKIFGLKSNTMKDIADTVLQTSGTLMTGVALITPVYKMGRDKVIKKYNVAIDKSVDNKYKHLENPKEQIEKSKLASDIQREIDRLKKAEKDQIKQYDANALKLGKSIMGGMVGMVSSVPIMFEKGPMEGTISIINSAGNLNYRLGEVKSGAINEKKIDELLEKYNMKPVNVTEDVSSSSSMPKGTTTQSGAQGRATAPSTTTAKQSEETLNTKKVKNYKAPKGALGFVAASASARTSTRVKNIIKDKIREDGKINDPYQTSRIELLYELQSKVLEEETKLQGAINELKDKKFPPVFYTPQENESNSSIAMNMALKDQYANLLEINLRQAMLGEPKVAKETVEEHITNYVSDNGHTPIKLDELQDLLDEIANEQDYDMGTEFEDNIRSEIAKNIINIAEDKPSKISSKAVKDEIIKKIEDSLERNNWNENASQSEIASIITNDVAEEVMQKLSANELTTIITSAINTKGTLKNKSVMPEFEELVETAAKIVDIETDISELTEEGKYNLEELVNEILNKDITD